MPASERTEYHWIENRVVPRVVTRPPDAKQWRFGKSEETLILTIEDTDRSFYRREGPAYSPRLEGDCILLHKGLFTDVKTPDVSKTMPDIVRKELRAKLDEAVRSIAEQWSTFAEEPDITGHLKGELTKVEVNRDRWRIKVSGWTYKRNPKEGEMGADLGVIIDVVYGEERVIKAIWYQAKIDKGLPLDQIEDLPDQVSIMQLYTSEAYTLLYRNGETVTMRGMDPGDAKPLSENLVEAAICVRGDRDPLVVVNTADIKHVVTFFISWNAS